MAKSIFIAWWRYDQLAESNQAKKKDIGMTLLTVTALR